jgi:hypothetical protein
LGQRLRKLEGGKLHLRLLLQLRLLLHLCLLLLQLDVLLVGDEDLLVARLAVGLLHRHVGLHVRLLLLLLNRWLVPHLRCSARYGKMRVRNPARRRKSGWLRGWGEGVRGRRRDGPLRSRGALLLLLLLLELNVLRWCRRWLLLL